MEHWQTGLDALDLRPALMAALLLATAAATAVAMVRLWLLFRALDVVIPGALLVSSVALISILQTLPVTVAGVGVRDVVLVAVVTRYGYTADRALALSGLFLALVIEQMLVGFFVSMSNPLGTSAPRGPLRPAASADETLP